MTQEIKLKLEQELAPLLTTYINQKHTQGECIGYSDGFAACAQTILENPSGWGLATKEDVMAKIKLLHDVEDRWRIKNDELKSQLAKYREVLERLLEENMCSHAGDELIEEALKHNEQ